MAKKEKDPEPVSPELIVWTPTAEEAGSRLVGDIKEYDESGGKGGLGYLDILREDGEQVRWYLNKPGRSALEYAMEKVDMTEDDLPLARIVVVFEGMKAATQPGFNPYRNFSVGVRAHVPGGQREIEQ